jgi:hypothetical protein
MRLFVGMTTWNSAAFLPASLAALRAMTDVIEDNTEGADRRVAEWLAARGYVPKLQVEQNVFYTRRDEP